MRENINLNKVNKLVESLENEDNKTSAIQASFNNDIQLQVRDAVGGFIVSIMKQLEDETELETLIKEEFIRRIQNGEMSVSELLRLSDQVKTTKDNSARTVLNFLKPEKGENIPLFDRTREENDGEVLKDLSSEQQQQLDKLSSIVERLGGNL